MKKLICFLMMSLTVVISSAEDAYLEANGTQLVKVNYYIGAHTKIVADFQYTDAAKSQALFGSRGDGTTSGPIAEFWLNGSGNPEVGINGVWSGAIRTGIDTGRHQIELDVANFRATLKTPGAADAVKNLSATTIATDTLALGIFGNSTPLTSDGEEGAWLSKSRIYSFKVYEGENLILDLIPCRKGGKAGFYNRKDERFYPSVTASDLVAGGDGVLEIEDDPYVSSPNGGVSVPTGYFVTPETTLEADFAFLDSETTQQFLFESYSDNYNPYGRIYVNGSKKYSWSFQDTAAWTPFYALGGENVQIPVVADKRVTAVLDSFGSTVLLTCAGVTNSFATQMTGTRTKTAVSQLRLLSNAAVSGNYGKVKLYGFRIFEGGKLVHDYKPMKCEGVGILKDALTGKTLVSSTSTALSFGGAVKEEPYVESRGNQIVTLDYKPNAKSVIEVDTSHVAREANKVLFGYGTEGAAGCFFHINSSTDAKGPGLEAYSHSVYSWRMVTGLENYGPRTKFVIDVPNSYCYVRRADGTDLAASNLASAHTGYAAEVSEAELPMALFNVNRASVDLALGATLRIYSANIYEEGVLLHSYQPYVKDGEIGFKDAVTGKFFAGLQQSGTSQVNALATGGAIAHEGELPEAYIESDQSQYLLTDYIPKATTKIALDFQLTKLHNDYYILGCQKDPTWTFYVNGSYGYTFEAHSKWDGGRTTTQTALMADLQRTTLILDRPNGTARIIRADVTKDYALAAAQDAAQTISLGLFARQEPNGAHYPDKTTPATGGMVPMRVYALRIYESGDLVHEYLPYRNGDVIGLKDTISGNVLTSKEGNPFVIGGTGYDEAKTFATALSDMCVAPNKSVEMAVFAPGAIRYEWTRAGVPLAETGDTVTLEWMRVKGDHAQEISVTPVYGVYGAEVKGEPSTAKLTNAPSGLTIIVR